MTISVPHCNTKQHAATHCNTLQRTAMHCNALQHTATYRNTLQHAATHYVLGSYYSLAGGNTAEALHNLTGTLTYICSPLLID